MARDRWAWPGRRRRRAGRQHQGVALLVVDVAVPRGGGDDVLGVDDLRGELAGRGAHAADGGGGRQVVEQVLVVDHAVVQRVPDATDLVEEHARVGRAVRRVAGGGAGDQRVDVRRDAGGAGRGGRDVLVDVLVGDLDRAVRLVRLVAGEHLVDEYAGGVHVGPGVGLAVDHQLGGEVGDRPDQDPPGRGVLRLGVDRARQAEVGDLDPAVVGEQDVLRLHVTVQDAGVVGGREGGEHRLDHRQGPGGRHRRFLADQVAHRQAGDVLHHQEERPVVVTGVEDGDHVVVGEPGGGAGLALEAAYELLVVGQPFVHHLDRDRAVEPEVGGLVDGGHPAAGDPGADEVATVEDATDERVGTPVHG